MKFLRNFGHFSPKNEAFHPMLTLYNLPIFDKVSPLFIYSITLRNYYIYLIIN